MKNIYLSSFIILAGLLCGSNINAQRAYKADFEKYETTPYFFRFGNKGALGEHTYKPRWMYSHHVIENPHKDENNSSSYVLEYTSMEARNYGLKFLFDSPIPLDELETISVTIYQPANVIGRSVESAYSTTPASKHNLCIKLLSAFNTINDFRQDDGILLYKDVKEHTAENEWKEYTFIFNKEDYSSQAGKFTNGVLGIAILPTYDADVTLQENDRYICYMDDITINKAYVNSIAVQEKEKLNINYTNGTLYIENPENNGNALVELFDLQGITVFSQSIPTNGSLITLPLSLSPTVYLLKMEINDQLYQQKLLITP